MDLALLGFLTLAAFLGLVLLTRTPVLVALILVPIAAAVVGGVSDQMSGMAIDGLRTVAPIAALMMFAVLYFGLMLDAGLFEPLVRGLVGLAGGDPVRLCLVTAALPMLVALDGDGATTFLISVTALLPVHRRMGMQPVVLPGIVALSAGVMNLLPWGGPTARAMTALNADVGQIFIPLLPAMTAGIAWVFLAAYLMGRSERGRLALAGPPVGGPQADPTEPVRIDRLFIFNAVLTVGLIVLLFQGLYADAIGLPTLPAPLLFMGAFAIALPVNRRDWAAQQVQLANHAPSVVLVTSMILAAGVFTGVLNGSGMITAMAEVLAGAVPEPLAPWLSGIVAVTSMPLSLVFTPDAYYFGVLPVFAETAAAVGHDPVAIGRAALMGQMTTGFPLSPLTASTFILLGLSGVTLRQHQRFAFKWAFATTLVMTAVAALTGAL
ncbi:MAG: citrate:proton symporter [Candidatus Brevundimonas colombiensis]|uniref:Citrate:proton symporter n=1 Tax=Candidatus Brevundimonas colombiensis TaxID=3121376 RepID=A0AAJ5X3K0_9CAUL|nr:citrate:proton symporter [Brevundimonas sp.]WEK41457.1 MAG: citrate:proton symporter [Brevundimonas sp.]